MNDIPDPAAPASAAASSSSEPVQSESKAEEPSIGGTPWEWSDCDFDAAGFLQYHCGYMDLSFTTDPPTILVFFFS
jgi:hypothetical protein